MKELKENGCLKLDSVSSEVVLLEEDLLITMTQAEGFVTEGDNNVTVVMDTRLTPELIEEGFVRELISKIQTMRKEAGFEVMDHIRVYFAQNDKIKALVDVLKSDEIKDFINEKYDGAVIPFDDSADTEDAAAEETDSKDTDSKDEAKEDAAEENAETTEAAEDAE